MKVKLYHKLVKMACKALHISKKKLFSRSFDEKFAFHRIYDFELDKLVEERGDADDFYVGMVITRDRPLSQLYKCLDLRSMLLARYWKHSCLKPVVQIQLDLGASFHEVLKRICKARSSAKCRNVGLA